VTLIGNCEFIFVIDMTTKIVASAYLIGSALLFAFPAIAHRIHKYNNSTLQEALQQRRILKICHRGSPRKAAENTMPSFEEGARVGDMLEMDVCFTKDEVLVVHHDLDLHRTCGVPGKISEMSYSELPRLKNEIELQFAEQGRTIKTNGEAIPTLE
jgi:glycerophosphoryl diester phosphodiesterase